MAWSASWPSEAKGAWGEQVENLSEAQGPSLLEECDLLGALGGEVSGKKDQPGHGDACQRMACAVASGLWGAECGCEPSSQQHSLPIPGIRSDSATSLAPVTTSCWSHQSPRIL